MWIVLLSLALAQPPGPPPAPPAEEEVSDITVTKDASARPEFSFPPEFLQRIPMARGYGGADLLENGILGLMLHGSARSTLREGVDGRPLLKHRQPKVTTLQVEFTEPFREAARLLAPQRPPDAHELSFNPEYGELPLAH